MKKRSLAILLLFFLAVSLVYAKLEITQPKDTYNLGDKLYITVNGILGEKTGNLNIDLVCGNSTTTLVKIPSRAFSSEEPQSYSLPYKILTKKDLEIQNYSQILGQCKIIVTMGGSIASTETFTISNKINIQAQADKAIYNPGEPIRISLEAFKDNHDALDGYIEVSNFTKLKKQIQNGKLTFELPIPESKEAGKYVLSIKAYDTDGKEILNSGQTKIFFEVRQVARSIVMALSKREAVPGEKFDIRTQLFDQSGKEMQGKTTIQIYTPKNKLFKKFSLESGKTKTLKFPTNSTAGKWKIIASFADITEQEDFEMQPIQKVKFEFDGPVLIIKNIGNTAYNKTVKVKIGDKTEFLDLNMEVGEVRKFSLKAPQGKYEVKVSDDKEEIQTRVPLTGRAISVEDLSSQKLFSSPFFWILIFFLLAAVGIFLFIKYKKSKTIDSRGAIFQQEKKTDKLKEAAKNLFAKKKTIMLKEGMVDLTSKQIKKAEQSLVLQGQKHLSAVLAIKCSNCNSQEIKLKLQQIVEDACDPKTAIDFQDEYILVIFSPLLTRTYNNEKLAARTAFKILNSIKEYNSKTTKKISFGMAINSGELICLEEPTKLKYTNIENTIPLAKKLASLLHNKLFVTEKVYRKLGRFLVVGKQLKSGNTIFYEVTSLRDSEQDKEKLKQLLKRSSLNKPDKKSGSSDEINSLLQ